MKKLFLIVILFWVNSSFAWEIHEPQVIFQDTVYTFEHHFVSDLPLDSLVSILYSKKHIININSGRNIEVSIPDEGPGWYDVQALYSYLWFYKNRIVMRRKIEDGGLLIVSQLVEFWQTFGVAPEPTSSIASYYLKPCVDWIEVTFIQKTTFESKLGRLANKVFIHATINYLQDVEKYIREIEKDSDSHSKLFVSTENK